MSFWAPLVVILALPTSPVSFPTMLPNNIWFENIYIYYIKKLTLVLAIFLMYFLLSSNIVSNVLDLLSIGASYCSKKQNDMFNLASLVFPMRFFNSFFIVVFFSCLCFFMFSIFHYLSLVLFGCVFDVNQAYVIPKSKYHTYLNFG
jgi:hypothetical protein